MESEWTRINSPDVGVVQIRIQSAPWNRGVEVAMFSHDQRYSWKQVQLAEHDDSTTTPVARLTMDGAQTLMDDLWSAGLRPTEGTGSAGSLKATQNHLEDMRSLVFKSKPKDCS